MSILERINSHLSKNKLQMDFLSFVAVLFNCTLILIYLYEYSIVSLNIIAWIISVIYFVSVTGISLYLYNKENAWTNVIWLLAVFIGLGFLPVYASLISGGKKYLLLNLLSSILILAIIVDWLFFMLISFFGILFAYLGALLYHGDTDFHIFHTSKKMYFITYLVCYTFIAISLFSRQKEKKQAKMLDFMKVFGGAIAHEVKAPLAAINMLSSTLDLILSQAEIKEKSGKKLIILDKADYEMLDTTIRSGLLDGSKEAMQIVEMLLTTVRNHSFQDNRRESAAAVVAEAVAMAETFDHKRIKVVIENDFTILCSKTMLKQVIYNLMKNSFKHGGEEVQVEVLVGNGKIQVKDDGVGIKPDLVQRIFESFVTNGKGHGIGLAFSSYALEGMNATLDCKSLPHQETTFTITFKT
jgi:signal transduction histidine kinase